jgi:hypothetical protein
MASDTGTRVCLPAGRFEFGDTLRIGAGVSLVGAGIGKPLSGPGPLGTVLAYTGDQWGVELIGHAAGLSNLAVVDTNGANAAGGVRVLADGQLVESVIVRNVLIFGFTEGVGFELFAVNNGGIAYGSFYDLRIRHAKTGIHIAKGSPHPSFVNSNTFFHGVFSGGGFEVGLHATEGNNNVFYATVFEAVHTDLGHVLVEEDAQVTLNNVRIEAQNSNEDDAIIRFAEGTYGSVLSGTFGGGRVIDLGDNSILFSSNSVDYRDPGFNLFQNSAFHGFDPAAQQVPRWTVTGNATLELEPPAVLPGHQVLKLKSVSGVVEVKPTSPPPVLETGKYLRCTFGAYMKAAVPQSANVVFKGSSTGTVSGRFHPGDGQWHFVGMTARIGGSANVFPRFRFEESGDVWMTTPTFTFGSTLPHLEASPLTSAGGSITGTLSTGLGKASDTDFIAPLQLRLPKQGNVFELDVTQAIHRINHSGADRFPLGTTITLVFENAGVHIVDNPYIELVQDNPFTSVQGGSLQLVSNGPGTWRELSRNP